MPDRSSDSAIDFYASCFCKEMLDAAHPTRFSKERITYGNDIFTEFRGHIWQANTEEEIAEDTRLVGTRRLPLARLDEGSRSYGRIIHNMLRPFGRREWKDHFFATYPDDRPVAFTIFDFDRHIPKGRSDPLSAESDEWLEIDERFWEQVSAFHGLATRFDLDVMWVQSPGRWLVDGHDLPCRMPGLYAVIRHEPRTPSELRPMLAALKERHGLEVEASWDARNRNIRIPGQCFMEVCRVDPEIRSIVPIRDPDARTEREMNTARLAVTVEEYGSRFRRLEHAHAGRVACRTLYGAFGGQRRFMAFQARHGILRVAQEHSQSQGRCRQWTLSPRAVRSVRLLMASPVLLFMVCGEGERVIYIQAPRASVRRRRRRGSRARRICYRRALYAPPGAIQARGPPPEARKTGENGVSGTIGGAPGARRRGEGAAAA